MQVRSILLLLVVAGGLLALVLLQEREARRDPDGLEDFAVFGGVDVDRVRVIDIDHGERNWVARLERDARDAWVLTDPVAYAAEEAAVRQLLEQVRGLRGEAVPDLEDLGRVGLDPPRASVAVTTRADDGAEATVRVDVGAIDVDREAVYVRAGDRVLRARRTLDNALLGGADDFRSKRLFDLPPLERPIELARSGELDGEDLLLEALGDGAAWRLVQPARGTLDPLAMHLFLQQVVATRLDRFQSDAPGPLATYGLDPPALRIEVRTVRGSASALRVGRPSEEGPWFCAREGHPFVFELDARDVRFLATPIETLLDYRVLRGKREDVSALRLEHGGRSARLYRAGAGWRATEDVDAEEPADSVAADPGAIDDLLARLEAVELATYLPPAVAFVPSEPPVRILVETADGSLQGGEIGAFHAVQGGDGGRMFRRAGDELVALVEEEVAALAATTPDDVRSLVLHALVEREQRAIALERDGEELVYRLDREANQWRAAGTSLEARDLALLVDRLLTVRVRRWLSPEEVPAEPTDAVSVRVEPAAGPPVAFRVVRDAGRELVLADGRAAEIRPGLLERLVALF